MDSADLEILAENNFFSTTFLNDVMLVLVFVLLSVFAWIFRLNTSLFGKMISNIYAGNQRQSIFGTTEQDSFLFNAYLTFQTLLMFSIFVFSALVKSNYLTHPSLAKTFLSLGVILLLFAIFYLLKRALHTFFGIIFLEKSFNSIILTNFQSLFCVWGVVLYLPVFWILIFDAHFFFSFIILIISYLILIVVSSLRIINIFYNKNTGFLFLILYLCGQEIVPLVLLYEGMVYIFKIIEVNNTWQ